MTLASVHLLLAGFSVYWGVPVVVIAGLLLGVYAFFSKK